MVQCVHTERNQHNTAMVTLRITLLPTVFTQRNLVADCVQVKCNFRKRPFCIFGPFGGIQATYVVRLRLIGKRVP